MNEFTSTLNWTEQQWVNKVAQLPGTETGDHILGVINSEGVTRETLGLFMHRVEEFLRAENVEMGLRTPVQE